LNHNKVKWLPKQERNEGRDLNLAISNWLCGCGLLLLQSCISGVRKKRRDVAATLNKIKYYIYIHSVETTTKSDSFFFLIHLRLSDATHLTRWMARQDGLLTRRPPNNQQHVTARYKHYTNKINIYISVIINVNKSQQHCYFYKCQTCHYSVCLAGFAGNSSGTMCYRQDLSPAGQPGKDI